MSDLEDAIIAACTALDPEPGAWVSLTEVRQQLAPWTKTDVDEALDRMYGTGQISLSPQPLVHRLTAEDHAAAVRSGGENHHLIQIEG
ncbi:hypothetical protein [Nonomuraea sp. 10N515B]|uniref:hypothetical protein n=1 Tax=Nonomuraea sp. 10N515B TaxID=3457422 RepID=UPI003FCD9603